MCGIAGMYFSDRARTRSRCDHAIETEGIARRRRHVLQSREEFLVDRIDWLAELGAVPLVRFEAGALLARIGELAEAVAQLDVAQVELEALAQLRVVRLAPRGIESMSVFKYLSSSGDKGWRAVAKWLAAYPA